MESKRLKVLLSNIHHWCNDEWKINQEDIRKTMNELQPDIAAFNEVNQIYTSSEDFVIFCHENSPWSQARKDVYEFAATLNAQACFGQAYSPTFGNAFISHLPMTSWTASILPEHGSGEKRGIVHLEVPHPAVEGKSLRLFAVHLDHQYEISRVKQLRDALEFARLCCTHDNDEIDDHLIMGDFNAACKDDYTPTYIDNLNARRKEKGWGDVVFDTVQLTKDRGYIDAYRTKHPTQCDGAVVTSPKSQLRIDYIWLSPGLAEKVDWDETTCSIKVISWTDHFPVLLDLVFKA